MEFVFIGLVGLGPLFFILLYRRSQMIKTAVLRAYFNGKLRGAGTELAFTFAGANWRFVRIGKNRRSYPVIFSTLRSVSGKLFLGHANAQPFAPFWVTKSRCQLINGLSFASLDSAHSNQLTSLISGPLVDSLKRIFDREFCHVTIEQEWHLQGLRVAKKTVVRFISVSEDVYVAPQKLEVHLQVLSQLVGALGLEFEESV